MFPDDPRERAEYFALLGEQQLHSGNYEQAVQMLRRALSLEPNVARYHGVMALALTNLKRHRAAEHEAKLALQIEPDDPVALIALGVVHHSLGRYPQALQVFTECVQQEPQNAHLWSLLATTYLSLEQYEDAEQAAKRALSLDPEETSAMSTLAQSLWARGNETEAEQIAMQGLARDPENDLMHALSAWVALHRNDLPSAIEHSLNALAKDPENEDAKTVLLLAYSAQRKWLRPYVRFVLWLSRFKTPHRIAMFVGGYATVNLLLRGSKQYTAHLPVLEPVLWVLLAAFWATVLYLVVCNLALSRMTRRAIGAHTNTERG